MVGLTGFGAAESLTNFEGAALNGFNMETVGWRAGGGVAAGRGRPALHCLNVGAIIQLLVEECYSPVAIRYLRYADCGAHSR